MELLNQLSFVIALGTVILQVITFGLLFILWQRKSYPRLANWIGKWALIGAFFVAFLATAGALFYELVLGLEPCSLCWWQRIFLVPQIILLGMAAAKRDVYMADYSIALSVFGLGVSLYQHMLQILPAGSLPCPSENISCAQRFIFEFGYVTFPLMAATVFAFLIVTMLMVRMSRE